jgi:hypothetical protein
VSLSDPEFGRSLKHLQLVEQYLHHGSVKRLSKMGPKMAIMQGKTVGDSHAAQMIASISCGGYNTVMLDEKIVDDWDDGRLSLGYDASLLADNSYNDYFEDE